MAYEGMLANALVTAIAAGAFLYVAVEVRRRRVPHEPRALASVLFFATVGVHLLLASGRQVVSYLESFQPALQALEAGIFYVTVLPAALAIVPLAYLATWALTGKDGLAHVVGIGFLAAIALGFGFILTEGITGPDRSFWGSEYTIDSLVAKAMILLVLTLPGLAAAVVLLRAGRGHGRASQRVRLIGWACLVYYAAFTLDALALAGAWLLGVRIVMALAALLGYRAYFGLGAEAPTAATAVAEVVR